MAHKSIQEIVCVFGQPVAGNPTQYIIEKAFAKAGLDGAYLTLEVAPIDLADAVRGLRAMGFRGCNLTIPHKVAVLRHLNRLSEAAQLMGAVNCVNRVGEELVGDNTDGKGFVQSLRELADPAGKSIVLLGAGGAARAIGIELALAGAGRITIVNRTLPRGEELAQLIREKVSIPAQPWPGKASSTCRRKWTWCQRDEHRPGRRAARVPLDTGTLTPTMVVADVVFNPPDTRLLRDARRAGCRTLDGLGMLVNQAVICFKIWTGVEPDRELMRESLEEFLGF